MALDQPDMTLPAIDRPAPPDDDIARARRIIRPGLEVPALAPELVADVARAQRISERHLMPDPRRTLAIAPADEAGAPARPLADAPVEIELHIRPAIVAPGLARTTRHLRPGDVERGESETATRPGLLPGLAIAPPQRQIEREPRQRPDDPVHRQRLPARIECLRLKGPYRPVHHIVEFALRTTQIFQCHQILAEAPHRLALRPTSQQHDLLSSPWECRGLK